MASRDEQSDLFLNSDAVSDDFFYDIIEKKLDISRDKFTIRLVLLAPATGKNENFVSVVYRAKIKIEILETKLRRSVDVIVKVLLSTMEEMKAFSVFPRERFMYEDVLYSYERIWLDRTGENIRFGPRSIKFETDPYEIIVLDDLKAEKYEMLKRQAGLNLLQSKLLLEKLAKFHAASAIRYKAVSVLSENVFTPKVGCVHSSSLLSHILLVVQALYSLSFQIFLLIESSFSRFNRLRTLIKTLPR